MIRTALFASALVVAGFAAPSLAPDGVVGQPMPDSDLVDFAQTSATSLDDLWGETLLVEFFAYW
ncbi:MAG: hypothetical protein P1V81_16995 [Planctomycetota bacterium]|nr:hypothetical protein [Planctomycetota bacterium]